VSAAYAARGKLKIIWVDPKELQVPDVRITSTWDPEMLEMFKASIDADGITQPLIAIREGETLWLVDGLHRRDEALLKGIQRVPVAVMDGSMRQVMTRNLYMNRLRGGIKASEMIKVTKWLQEKEGMTIEQIQAETGLKRDYVEKLLECARAQPEVLEELDREVIGVGHAWELARLQDRDAELRSLALVHTYRLTVKATRDMVDETLKILEARRNNPDVKPQLDLRSVPTIQCHGCGLEWPLRKVVGVNLCVSCYGTLQDEINRRRKTGEIPDRPQ
jgi:ParB-like chromosome segregation protein Spo0J